MHVLNVDCPASLFSSREPKRIPLIPTVLLLSVIIEPRLSDLLKVVQNVLNRDVLQSLVANLRYLNRITTSLALTPHKHI
jgi:hypothetical protein